MFDSWTLTILLIFFSPHLHRSVVSFSLFYRYYYGHRSSEFLCCMLPPLGRAHATIQSYQFHSFSLHLSNARINQFSQSFLYTTGKLWNILPFSIFPLHHDFQPFKQTQGVQTSRTLQTMVLDFFYCLFLTEVGGLQIIFFFFLSAVYIHSSNKQCLKTNSVETA